MEDKLVRIVSRKRLISGLNGDFVGLQNRAGLLAELRRDGYCLG